VTYRIFARILRSLEDVLSTVMGDAKQGCKLNRAAPQGTRTSRAPRRLSICAVLALCAYSCAALAAQPFNNGGTAANGQTIYQSGTYGCSGCHGSPNPQANMPQSPGNLPAANVAQVLVDAINTDAGGYMNTFAGDFTSAQMTDITAYIGNYTPPTASGFTYTTAIPYGASNYQFSFASYLNGTCTDLNSCNAASSYNGTITGITIVAGASKGTVTPIINTGTGTAVFNYTATAGKYGADSFTYKATGPGGSSATVTVNVTIATPPAPTLSGVPTQNIAYSASPSGVSIPLAAYISGVVSATPLTINTGPTKGTVSISGETLTYTPNAADYGADSIVLNVVGPGGTTTGTVPISINVGAPTDNPATEDIAYNGSFTLNLSTLVTPYFAGATTFAIDQQPTDSTAALTITGTSVTYTASPTFYGGTDTFKYHAISPGGTPGLSGTVTININTPPTPVANSSSTSVAFDSSANVLPLSVMYPYVSVAVTTLPSHGTATATGTSISYTPTTGYTGTDTLQYTATNSGGTSMPATITITVTAPGAPGAGSTSATASYNTAKVIDLTSVITGAVQGVTIITNATHGNAVVGTGANALMVTYTPATNYVGPDSFTYQAIGYPASNVSPTNGTVSLTVAAPGTPTSVDVGPVAIGYNSTGVAIPLAGAVTGAAPINITVGTAAHGTVTLSGTTATYTPTTLYYGSDSFTFYGSNPGGSGNTSTVHLTVANPPPPTVAAKTLSVGYNSSAMLDLTSAVTGVFTPPLAIGTAPVHGTATFAGDVVTYTSTLGYFGSDTFTYIATGPGGASAPGTVTVTVATPSAPVAGPASLAVPYNTAATIDLSHTVTGVYTSTAIASQPAHGTVTLAGNVASYTPTNLYYGADSFTYTATGAGGTSAAGTVTVTVATPAAPTVQGASGNVAYNTPMTISLASSVSGVYASLAISTPPSHGTAVLTGTSLVYTPTSGYYGPDSLNFTATGPGGTSAPAALSLTVVRPNAPVAGSISVNDPFNKPVVIDLTGIVTGYANGIAISTAPQNGSASVSGLRITYTPNSTFYGQDSISYTATGPGGASAPGLISITVQTAPPHAWNTSLTVVLNTTGNINLSNWISGSGITGAAIATGPAHGSATMTGTVLSYTPKPDFFGTDTLTYRAFGILGTSNVGTLTITVTGRPDPSQNSDVQGIIASEMSTAERFARAQMGNFQSHLSSLHANSIDDEDATQDGAPAGKPAGTPGADGKGYSSATPLLPAAGGILAAGSGSSSTATSVAPQASASAASVVATTANGTLIRSDTQVAGSAMPSSMFGSASMQRTSYFPGTPPAIGPDSAPLTQTITSLDLGSMAGSMLGDQNAASVDHRGLSSVWVLGSVNFGERTPAGAAQNFDTDGVSFGVDYRFSPQLVAGLGAGYGRDKTSIGSDGTRTRATGVDVAAYASYAPTDHTFVDAVVGAGSIDFDASRTVAPIDAAASSHRDGDQLFASVAAGYEWHKNGAHATPYVRLDASQTRLDQSSEEGAAAYDLTYAKQNQTSVAAALGLKLDTAQQFDAGVARPHITIEYQHEFENDQAASLNYSDLIGTSYTTTPNVLDHNTLSIGFGSDFLFRHGLSIGWDYQVIHASGIENSQMIRVKLSQDLDKNFVLPLVAIHPLAQVRVDLAYTYDDNVTRSTDKLPDQFWSLGLSREFVLPFNENSRVTLEPSLGFDKYESNVLLSHGDAGIKAQLQYRSTGDFSSPTYALFTTLSGSNYESSLRDGEHIQLGTSIFMPLTDRINGFAAIGADGRHARSEVWDGADGFVRANLDYALSESGTLYLSGEYRNGDMVSTGFASLANLDSAKIYVTDDAFPNSGRIAYRFNGAAGLFTLGYNQGISSTGSFDVSYRLVTSSPNHQPDYNSAPTIRYVDHQLSLVYLVRF
jgi:uncharacterized protein YhjY with autotransporter beta-barrel domain/mono/diheme cytochrome c family protein